MAKKLYKLRRKYWDGKVQHNVGAVLPFEEGQAPSSAVLQEEPKDEPPKPEKK